MSGLDLNMNHLSHLWLVLNSVGSLLELSDLSYDMRYLQTECHDLSVNPRYLKDKSTHINPRGNDPGYDMISYHSHL